MINKTLIFGPIWMIMKRYQTLERRYQTPEKGTIMDGAPKMKYLLERSIRLKWSTC